MTKISHVSIPFIAGQWSLLWVYPAAWNAVRLRSQSPSLLGSGRFFSVTPVLAHGNPSQSPSLRGSGRFGRSGRAAGAAVPRLNPLHCGAVVASGGPASPLGAGRRVSIPFIAGQWSLLPP